VPQKGGLLPPRPLPRSPSFRIPRRPGGLTCVDLCFMQSTLVQQGPGVGEPGDCRSPASPGGPGICLVLACIALVARSRAHCGLVCSRGARQQGPARPQASDSKLFFDFIVLTGTEFGFSSTYKILGPYKRICTFAIRNTLGTHGRVAINETFFSVSVF
jgi:hypothetical protein